MNSKGFQYGKLYCWRPGKCCDENLFVQVRSVLVSSSTCLLKSFTNVSLSICLCEELKTIN